MSHHDFQSCFSIAATESANIIPRNARLFQQNRPKADIGLLVDQPVGESLSN
jgi:hypothetical protein